MRKAIIDVIVPRGDRYIEPSECRAVIEIEGEEPRNAPRIFEYGKKDYMEVKTLCAALKAVGEPCVIVVETYSRHLAGYVDAAVDVVSGRKRTRSVYAREIANAAKSAGHRLLPSRYAPYGWKFGADAESGQVIFYKQSAAYSCNAPATEAVHA